MSYHLYFFETFLSYIFTTCHCSFQSYCKGHSAELLGHKGIIKESISGESAQHKARDLPCPLRETKNEIRLRHGPFQPMVIAACGQSCSEKFHESSVSQDTELLGKGI